MLVSSGMSRFDDLANLVLVDNPAFVFLIPAVVAATVFDNLVDRQGLQSSVGSQDITVACLAYSRRTGNYDVGLCPRHVYDGRREQSLRLAETKVQYCQEIGVFIIVANAWHTSVNTNLHRIRISTSHL